VKGGCPQRSGGGRRIGTYFLKAEDRRQKRGVRSPKRGVWSKKTVDRREKPRGRGHESKDGRQGQETEERAESDGDGIQSEQFSEFCGGLEIAPLEGLPYIIKLIGVLQ